MAQLSTTGMADARVGLGLGVALAGSGVAGFLLPALRIGAQTVEVHNVVQIVTVPFSRLDAIEAQWTLELLTDNGRRVGVMAAPARSRSDRHRPDHAETPEAALVVQEGWDAWRKNHAPVREDAPADATAVLGDGPQDVTRQPNLPGIACVVVAVVGAVVAFFF